MPGAAVVTIRRQVLKVDLYGSEAEGHALQRRLPRLCTDVLSPAIESALGPFDGAGRSIYLHRLDLEVTLTSLNGFEAELAAAVRRGIEEHLARHPPASPGPTSVGARAGPSETTLSADTGSADDALVVFLRTGRLPWWFSLPPGTTLEQVLLAAWAEVGDAAGGLYASAPGGLYAGGPLRAAMAVPEARVRLVAQFTPGFVLMLLRTLAPELAVGVERIDAALSAGPRATRAGRGFRRRVREIALEAAAAGERWEPAALVCRAWTLTPDRAEPTLAAEIERAWPGTTAGETTTEAGQAIAADRVSPATPPARAPAPAPDRVPVAAPERASVAAATEPAPVPPAAGERWEPAALVRRAWTLTPDRAEPTLAAEIERAWPGTTAGETTTEAGQAIAADRVSPATPPARAPAPAPDRVPVAAPERASVAAATEPAPVPPAAAAYAPSRDVDQLEHGGLLVDHAGIVLLHPFLPRFFTGLGVAAGDALVDPSRALSLLHHLATGEVVAPEHRLTLAKALCGVPLESPCEADIGLTVDETAEATDLLEAAVGHWAALRSTSPDGLRAEFLQRPGVLSVTADGDWLVRVEGRTVDILLDQLPWGFSLLRLPWMSRLMMVEWR